MCCFCQQIIEEKEYTTYDNDIVVSEIKHVDQDGYKYHWGHDFKIPINYCPNCGEKIKEVRL